VTGALAWARLSYRQQRWELLLVALGVAGVVAGMVWFATTLGAMRAAFPDCLTGVGGSNVSVSVGPEAACQAVLNDYYGAEDFASTLLNLAWAAPFGMGVILGAPLVAREIDGGTAQLAWSLSLSRVGWLLRRIAFIAIFGLVLLALLAVTSEVLAAAILPDRTLGEDFVWFGRRGLPVVARGVGAIMIGVLVGAFIGRVLPAVLASAVIIGLVFTGLSLGHDQWNRAEAILQPMYASAGDPMQFDMAALDIQFGIEMANGTFMTYPEAFDSGLTPNFTDERGRVYASEADLRSGDFIGHDARLTIPGGRYPELVVRDSIIAVLVGLAALSVTAMVVTRRRPV
jgi:hypothetical protein